MRDTDDESALLEIERAANEAISPLIPAKSRAKYDLEYNKFEDWCKTKNLEGVSEKILLAYFLVKAEREKPSTLWTHYSMLRSTISVNKSMDISKYTQLIAFLKRKSEGYKPKKSSIFSKDEIHKFLREANDVQYLMIKVSLIIGIFGACRREELKNMLVDDIEDKETFIKITIPNTKTKIVREFAVTKGNIPGYNCLDNLRKYFRLRPQIATHGRLFVFYRGGKCTSQPVGVNTFGRMPKDIATYLGLKNPHTYTGHCFRRSSASLLADAGADMHTLKRHGGWKSTSVAEGYVETSIENKRIIARKIMGENETETGENENISDTNENFGYVASTSTSAGINISNCKNFVMKVYNK